jgi:signal transduction histidine kinase
MKKYIEALNRGEVTSFSRNSYEVIFSVFMIALAYFYRSSPQIVYPRILYFFLLLLASNFLFNRLLRQRGAVNVWLIDLILLSNFWLITGVIYYSGKGDSYFWALYLLPVFAASLMASLKDALGVVGLCSIAIAVMAWPLGGGDLAKVLALGVKMAVLAFSAGVVYTTAQSRKRAEAVLVFKREQVALLERAIIERESEIVKTASAGEMGTLVSGVLHDLGNAVSVMLLSAQIAYEDEKPEKKDIERILKASKFAKSVISNAMSLVRGQEYVFEKGDLKEAAENAALLTEYAARKKNATVRLELSPAMPPLRMSSVHIERVFINAVSNSLSFVPEKGEVTVSASAAGGVFTIVIADNGPGFPEKLLDSGVKAFDTTRKEKGGTGLGLFVCEQIVLRHGGSMKLANVPGGGARITITLPENGPNEKQAGPRPA